MSLSSGFDEGADLISHSGSVDFSKHPDAERALLKDIKIVRFQENPQENWGPQTKAKSGQAPKKSKNAIPQDSQSAIPEQGAEKVDVTMTDNA